MGSGRGLRPPAPKYCDYCRLQRLGPSEIFKGKTNVCASCGTRRLTIPGYAESRSVPTLNIKQSGTTRAWHGNVPLSQVRLRRRAKLYGLSFEDPIVGRSNEAQGEGARHLLKVCGIDCVYHYPAPFRLVLFDLSDGALGACAGTVQYDVLRRYVNAVAVAPAWRRKGVSRFLLAAAMDHISDCQPHGAEKPISLYVTLDDAVAQPFLVAFYESLGFRGTGGFGLMHVAEEDGDESGGAPARPATCPAPSPRASLDRKSVV